MGNIEKLLRELEPEKLEEKIIRQVAEQLAKDFNDIQFEIIFTGHGSPYLELRNQVQPVIEYLLEKNPGRLFHLFYRIDIPEQKVKALMGEADVAMAYTDLILNRELQKVVTRNFYSSSS